MKGVHLRTEHDVVEYITSHLRNRPTILEALEYDNYDYLGSRQTNFGIGKCIRVESLRCKRPIWITVVVGKPPRETVLVIQNKEPNLYDSRGAHEYTTDP